MYNVIKFYYKNPVNNFDTLAGKVTLNSNSSQDSLSKNSLSNSISPYSNDILNYNDDLLYDLSETSVEHQYGYNSSGIPTPTLDSNFITDHLNEYGNSKCSKHITNNTQYKSQIISRDLFAINNNNMEDIINTVTESNMYYPEQELFSNITINQQQNLKYQNTTSSESNCNNLTNHVNCCMIDPNLSYIPPNISYILV